MDLTRVAVPKEHHPPQVRLRYDPLGPLGGRLSPRGIRGTGLLRSRLSPLGGLHSLGLRDLRGIDLHSPQGLLGTDPHSHGPRSTLGTDLLRSRLGPIGGLHSLGPRDPLGTSLR